MQTGDGIRRRLASLAARLRGRSARRDGAPHVYDDAASDAVAERIRWLEGRNTTSTASVVDPSSDVTVTMTTYGDRLRTTWTALESIADGDVLPGRLVLAISADAARRLPPRIRSLQRRGLEVLAVDPRLERRLGVHTKWHPVAQTLDGPLVTSDDDQVYPREWLAELVRTHRDHPHDVVAHRVHMVGIDDGVLRPYSHWMPCTTTEPGAQHFGTSVSGQLFPLAVVRVATASDLRFLDVAPTADDVWLHRCALEAGASVRQVTTAPANYPFVPGTQGHGLYQENVMGGRNDEQIAATYDGRARDRLLSGQ